MTTPEVSLRPATADDSEFAYCTTRDTMREYVRATWGEWNAEEGPAALVRKHRSRHHSDHRAGKHCGRIQVVKREPDSIRLLQIFILPEYQRRGIGSQLIERLLAGSR